MAIAFSCGCGQSLSAPDAHAGQAVRCTGCGASLVVPRSESSATATAIVATLPGKRAAPLWVWAGLAVLLVAAGFAIFWLLRRETVSPDFDLVPRDAQGFVTIRVADALATPAGRKLREALGDRRFDVITQFVGLPPEEIERLTIVVVNGSEQRLYTLVHTRGDYKETAIRRTIATVLPWEHGKYTLWQTHDASKCVCFVKERLYIVAPNEASILLCLDRREEPSTGPLADALKRASAGDAHFVAAINLEAPGARDNVRQEVNRFFVRSDPVVQFLGKKLVNAVLMPLLQARMGTITGMADDVLHLSASGDFFSDADAAKGEEALTGLLKHLPNGSLDSLRTERDGMTVSATLDIDAAAVAQLLRILLP